MKQHRSLILMLVITLFASIAYGLFSLPSPKGIGEEGFSSARVIEDLKVIAKEPHSVAHPEAKDKVLQYLTERLHKLGGETQKFVYPNIKARQYTFDVQNILAIFPPQQAMEDTTYVMLVAHYDSCQPWNRKNKKQVSKGAADDGYGLGVILESIRQSLKYRKDWHQGIKVLFTDGEEMDLQGMKAAYRHNKEIFSDVGLIINVEARGPFGPALLFETSPGNERIIELYGENASYPFTYSLTNVVYRYMPNGTDFTIVKDSIPGMNFSAIADINHYHTDLDNLQNISPKTIQHYGEQITPILEAYLTNPDYSDKEYFAGKEDSVYFTIPLLGMFRFSPDRFWLLNTGIVLLLLHLMMKDKDLRWKRLCKQTVLIIAISIGLLIVGEMIAWLSAWMAGIRFRKFGILTGIPFDNAVMIFSILFLVIGSIRYYRYRTDTSQSLSASLFTLMILSLVCLSFIGENMMFFIPWCIGTLSLMLWRATSARIFPLLGMGMILLHALSFVYVLAMALTIGSLGIFLMVAFYNLIVIIPLAKGYLTDTASSRMP